MSHLSGALPGAPDVSAVDRIKTYLRDYPERRERTGLTGVAPEHPWDVLRFLRTAADIVLQKVVTEAMESREGARKWYPPPSLASIKDARAAWALVVEWAEARGLHVQPAEPHKYSCQVMYYSSVKNPRPPAYCKGVPACGSNSYCGSNFTTKPLLFSSWTMPKYLPARLISPVMKLVQWMEARLVRLGFWFFSPQRVVTGWNHINPPLLPASYDADDLNLDPDAPNADVVLQEVLECREAAAVVVRITRAEVATAALVTVPPSTLKLTARETRRLRYLNPELWTWLGAVWAFSTAESEVGAWKWDPERPQKVHRR